MDRYDRESIEHAVHTKWAGRTVHFVLETDSTNRMIRDLAKEGASHGTLAVADYQDSGRGRFERKWIVPPGTSVMMTILLRPDLAPDRASMLTLVMGLSAAQAVQKMGFPASIKWPNDVVLSKKKICGILTEMRICPEQNQKIDYVEIGIGINVNLAEFPEELKEKATSLMLEAAASGAAAMDPAETSLSDSAAASASDPSASRASFKRTEFDRNLVIGLVMEAFEKNYERFEKTQDLRLLKEEYERLLANRGEEVRVLENTPWEGRCLGISTTGELLVQKKDGTIREVRSGEVSVRGLYSYV